MSKTHKIFHAYDDVNDSEIGMLRNKGKPIDNTIPMLIFLDVDGVLNGDTSNGHYVTSEAEGHANKYQGIDPDRVALLNQIHEYVPGSLYIMSSTWRQWYLGTQAYLNKQGFTGKFIGHTEPYIYGRYRERSSEIENWMQKHCQEYKNPIVVIDDDYSVLDFEDRPGIITLRTYDRTGLVQTDVDKFKQEYELWKLKQITD
jgi:hypothetical protein